MNVFWYVCVQADLSQCVGRSVQQAYPVNVDYSLDELRYVIMWHIIQLDFMIVGLEGR